MEITTNRCAASGDGKQDLPVLKLCGANSTTQMNFISTIVHLRIFSQMDLAKVDSHHFRKQLSRVTLPLSYKRAT